MSSVASPALASSAPATVLVVSVSHEDSTISKLARSRLFKLIGRMWLKGGVAASSKKIWWLAYEYTRKMRNYAMDVDLEVIKTWS